jgi:hypothetical protein
MIILFTCLFVHTLKQIIWMIESLLALTIIISFILALLLHIWIPKHSLHISKLACNQKSLIKLQLFPRKIQLKYLSSFIDQALRLKKFQYVDIYLFLFARLQQIVHFLNDFKQNLLKFLA